MKLDKEFNNDQILLENFKPSDIIGIGIFVIAGILIIDNIPGFLSHSYFALKSDLANVNYSNYDKFLWAVNGANLVVGWMLIANYKSISSKFKAAEKEDRP